MTLHSAIVEACSEGFAFGVKIPENGSALRSEPGF
jgi:hypothetical protein